MIQPKACGWSKNLGWVGLKMSMYLFNIFNKSKDNDHITTILACWDINCQKCWFLKKVKTSHILAISLLYLWKYLINQNKKYLIRKDWNFCDEKLQYFAILILLFFQNIFHWIIQKVMLTRKSRGMNKKLHFYIIAVNILQYLVWNENFK